MNHKNASYLGGRVKIESLGKDQDATGRFRNGDQRGEVAMVVSNSNIEFVELAEFVDKDIKRGYHYHKSYKETLYLISGQLKLAATDVKNKDSILINISAGDSMTILPGIAHAYLSLEKSLVLSMGSNANPFSDRHIYTDFDFTK